MHLSVLATPEGLFPSDLKFNWVTELIQEGGSIEHRHGQKGTKALYQSRNRNIWETLIP